MNPAEIIEQRYPATAEAVPMIRHAIVELAARLGADVEHRTGIALAVTEGCANVVVHAYDSASEQGEMLVRARGDGEGLDVVVTDEGSGVVPREDSPGLGLGIQLMSELAESVDFRTAPGGRGTELHLHFGL
jgi:serine/threonine-protein kinase RsbW/stage II sporulation protein AB (anti-sigma F factor)